MMSTSIMKFKPLDHFPNNLKELLNLDPLVVIKKQKLDDLELLSLAASISDREGELKDKVLHWDFGPIMNMHYQTEAQNYLFSEEKVPFHWDGAFHLEPRYLIFYCIKSEGEGGETLFSDSRKIYADVKNLYPNLTLTYQTEKKAHYGGVFTTDLYKEHPTLKCPIVRFAEIVETKKNPVSLVINSENVDKEIFYNDMTSRLYGDKYCYEHIWDSGDLLIVDNFIFLHGRKKLGRNLERSFKRVQVL